MKVEEYKLFKKMYLEKFRKYYRDKYTNKRELKRSVYDNPNLNDKQKDTFWRLVVSK